MCVEEVIISVIWFRFYHFYVVRLKSHEKEEHTRFAVFIITIITWIITQSKWVGQTGIFVPKPVSFFQITERLGDDATERRPYDTVVDGPFRHTRRPQVHVLGRSVQIVITLYRGVTDVGQHRAPRLDRREFAILSPRRIAGYAVFPGPLDVDGRQVLSVVVSRFLEQMVGHLFAVTVTRNRD